MTDIRTIQMTPYMQAQGEFVRKLPDGRIIVKDDSGQTFVGKEIQCNAK